MLVLGGNFGYRSWQGQELAAAEAASDAFSTFQTATRESATDAVGRAAAITLGETFIADHAETHYAVLAGLQVAKLYFSAGNLSEAEAALRKISGSDKAQLQPLVQIRLARLLGAQDRPEEGLTVLAGPTEWAGFIAARHEAEGDLLFQLDRLDEARQAYQLAVNTAGADVLPGLTMKVEDLTFVAAPMDLANAAASDANNEASAGQEADAVASDGADEPSDDTKDNG